MNATAKNDFVKCWDACNEAATHVMTREGSITLHACDRHTRIDREEAEARGWTIAPLTGAPERPRVGERVTYKAGRHTVHATVTSRTDAAGRIGIVDDGDQTGHVHYVTAENLVVQEPDLDELHGRALYEDSLRAILASVATAA